MADEQIIVDIKVESKEIVDAKKVIDKLSLSVEDLSKQVSDARKSNKKYKKEQEDLNKQFLKGKISTEKYENATAKLSKKIDTNNKIIADTTVKLSKQKSERAANIRLVNTETSSLGRLEAQATLLNKAITKQKTGTKELDEEYAKLESELGKVNGQINEQRQAFKDNTKNIGNYTESIDKSRAGTNQLSKSFKALLANPVVLILAAIAIALKALFEAFKRSESGSKLMSKAMAGLQGMFSVFIKVVDTVTKALISAFEDPQKAVEDLWESIKSNIVDRFTGLIDLFGAFGKIIKSALTANLEDLADAASEVNEALVQIATGITPKDFEDISQAMIDAAAAAAAMTAEFIALEAAQRFTRSATRELEKEIATLNAEFEMLGQIAGDDTRNMEEMRQAAIDAGVVAAKITAKQTELAQKRLDIINEEVDLRMSANEDVQDLLDQQANAEISLTEAKSSASLAQQAILIEQKKIERDQFEQNLDILLDVGDKIKTEQEKQLQNENLTLEERKRLFEASKVALTANFDAIKAEYELYGVTAEEINDVIMASDAQQTNAKLKALGFDEIANNRLREIILERRQAELDFNDIQIELAAEEVERTEELAEVKEEALKEELETRTELYDEFFDATLEATNEFADKELELFSRIGQGIAKAFEDGKISAENALTSLGMVSNALFDNSKVRRDKDLSDNEIARTKEIELANGSETAILAINKKFDEENAELKRKQFNSDKAKAVTDILIQTALAVTKSIAASPLTFGLPFSAIVAGLGAVQGSIVAAQKAPTFAGGIGNIVDIGGSHASGNDVDVFGVSGGQKQYFGKVEKGEAMPVIRKSAANDYLVSKLNGKYSKGGSMFEGGTNDITSSQSSEIFNQQLITAIENMQFVAKIEDITYQAKRKIQIVDNSKF